MNRFLLGIATLMAGLCLFVSCNKNDDDPEETTSPSNQVTDSRDGRVYKIVTLGTQTWFAENLNFSPSIGTGSCYADKADSCTLTGKLYDSTAMKSNPCPDGWHVPSDEEWKTLEMYLGMESDQADMSGYRGTNEGDKLKKDSAVSVGFNAILGGGYASNFGYIGNNINVAFWSSTKTGNSYYGRAIDKTSSKILRGMYPNSLSQNSRFCIRCLKN